MNPIAPEGADETTLGGYAAIHGRAAAFEGSDGSAYTVAIEVEPADASGAADEDPDGDAAGVDAFVGYLVFVRWAAEGSAIMGHLETGDLASGETEEATHAAIEALTLTRVKEVLEAEIERKRQDAPPGDSW